MRRREVIVGLAVLAVLAAGAWWARSPSPTAPMGPAGQAVPAPASTAVPSPPADDEALPDVTLAGATVDAGGVRIAFAVSPNPPITFATTRVRVRAESGGTVVALEGGRVSFEMTMPMGDHRYLLVPAEDGWQEAEVILPRCMSGNRRWYATVEGTVAGQPRTARFRLDLAPPK